MAFTKAISQISPTLVKMGTGSTTPVGGTNDLLTNGNPVKFQVNTSFIKIRHHSNSFTKRPGIPGQRYWDIALQSYLQGSGAAGTIAINGYAALDALMRSSGMSVTSSGGTLLYVPATIAHAGTAKCEIWNENHGLLNKAINCQGNIVMEGVPTDGMKINWTGRGDYAEPTLANISGFTGGTDRAEAFLNIAGTVVSTVGGTATPVVSRMTFDRGIELGKVDDAQSATGLKENFTKDATPKLTMVMALDTDSAGLTYPKFLNDYHNKVTHAVNFTHGQTALNRCLFTFPQAQISRISGQEGDGYVLATVEYELTHSTDNSEFSIAIF